MIDPRPEAVRLELGRVVRRWQQLPLDRTSAFVPQVRALGQRFAELSGESGPLPQLGPAATLDQLRVTSYDACAAGHAETVAALLRQLRRALD